MIYVLLIILLVVLLFVVRLIFVRIQLSAKRDVASLAVEARFSESAMADIRQARQVDQQERLVQFKHASVKQFKGLLMKVFEGMGYNVTVTQETVPFVVEKDGKTEAVFFHQYDGKALLEKSQIMTYLLLLEKTPYLSGYLVTSGAFSVQAQAAMETERLQPIDGRKLANLVRAHYPDWRPSQ